MMSDQSQALNLDEVYAFARDVASSAGQLLLDSLEKRRNGSSAAVEFSAEKENAVDIVTKTDQDVEDYVHSRITEAYPDHAFIGEETYSKQAGSNKPYQIQNDKPTWCVDPLDGTVNYVHAFPTFAVSIAFIVSGKPVIGVIAAPFLNQVFHACTGSGAWLTTSFAGGPTKDMRLPIFNNPVPPLPDTAPKGCLFSFEWGKDRRDQPNSNLHRKVQSFINMATEIGGRGGKGAMVHGMRSLGSAALDLAYTAMGSFDLWWEGGCWEWDVAAGIAILHEAGGIITTANPPNDPETALIEPAKLGGRLYLAVRPVGPSANGESGKSQQERVVREVWRRVNSLDYSRPDV